MVAEPTTFAPMPRKRRTNGATRPASATKLGARLTVLEQLVIDLGKSVRAAGDERILGDTQRKRTDDALTGLKDAVTDLTAAIGHEGEDEYGKKTGTGVVGRLMRLEIRVGSGLRFTAHLRSIGYGVAGTVTALAPVIWWLTSDKLAHIFK